MGPFVQRVLLAITLLLLLWVGGLGAFILMIPSQFTDEQTPTRAIVVLTGGRERLKTGFQLLEAKRADVIFISGVNREETLKSLFKHLETSRVIAPGDRDRLASSTYIGYEANNTKENAEETAKWVKQMQIPSLRLVTAAYHMPRSLLELKHLLPQTTITPHPVFPHGFNRSHWWRNEDVLSLITSEYNKYLWAFVRIHMSAQGGKTS